MCKQSLAFCLFLGLFSGIMSAQAADVPTSMVPAAVFFPVLPVEAAPDAEPELLPVASNHPLNGDHTGITRAVIVVHDFSRDAGHALSELSGLAGNDNNNTLIIAPQFLLESDITRFADHLPDNGKNFARWPLGGWNSGGDSLQLGRNQGISSFTVMDLLLMYLADKTAFPALTQVTIAGHGEGGDFVQRYAAAGQATGLLNQQNILVRFLVGDASSYVYFTTSRSQNGKQVTDVANTASGCADYNSWPYGLEAPNNYVKHVGANAIKLGYVMRPVIYIVGASPAHADPAPDNSCAATMQGSNRPGRAAAYQTYLATTFGETAQKLHSFSILTNTGYDDSAIYGSPCGVSVLFGDGMCTPAQTNNILVVKP